MCGICGKLDLTGRAVSEELLADMCARIAYRGPDDQGVLSMPPVGLGHRRLSIIDLSTAGRQPMSNEDGTIWLVYNGEIYDFQGIRKSLLERGHTFKSATDAEVILHLYEEEGLNCLGRFNGMFAFALWDAPRKRLWLVRDRLGIKPLCYAWDGERLVFGSEIKAVLADPAVPREIDREGLDLYLTLNFIPPPHTIFRGIRKLTPGSYALVEDGEFSIREYWDITDRLEEEKDPEPGPGDMETLEGDLFRLLDEAVARRLIADVPLGAFLSGGLDSSIVVGLMSRHMDRPVQTFSIGYRDLKTFDETSYAREVAAFHKTDHHEFRLGHEDVLGAFTAVLENLDEPFADSSAVPTHIVSRKTRGHVTVALSGDGGDELFAGYRMYRGEHWARIYTRIPRFLRSAVVEPCVGMLPERRNAPGLELARRAKKFLRGMGETFPERFCGWREIFPLQERRSLLRVPPAGTLYLDRVRRDVKGAESRFPGDPLNLMLYLDARGLLHGDMLTKVDRMSMANALEVRVPMLDHKFVEYVFSLPGHLKMKGNRGKLILKSAFRGILPESLLNRPKMGFELPINAWLRKELRFLVEDYLHEGRIERQGVFDAGKVKELVAAHMSGYRDTSWHLWNLIVFGHWYRTYME